MYLSYALNGLKLERLTDIFCFTGEKSDTAALFFKSSRIFAFGISLCRFSFVKLTSTTHSKICWLDVEKNRGTMPSGTATFPDSPFRSGILGDLPP